MKTSLKVYFRLKKTLNIKNSHTILVVVDYDRNPHADTGNFELILKEKPQVRFSKKNQRLEITGTPVPENYFCDIAVDDNKQNIMPEKFETPDPAKFLLETGETMKEALKNLLEIVKREKMKRFVINFCSLQQNSFIKQFLKTYQLT